jgi:hypothetical protein
LVKKNIIGASDQRGGGIVPFQDDAQAWPSEEALEKHRQQALEGE